MKFLVAIDGSEASRHALARAIQFGQPAGAQVILLTVAEPASGAFWPGVLPTGEPLYQGPPAAELEQAARTAGEAALEMGLKLCEAAHLPCQTRLEFGSAREVICAVAEEVSPDMLVVGSHGRGNLERLVLGSVSDYVVHHAHCPVLVVR